MDLNYQYQGKAPVPQERSSGSRTRLFFLFSAVAMVTAGLIFYLIPKDTETKKLLPPPAEPAETSAAELRQASPETAPAAPDLPEVKAKPETAELPPPAMTPPATVSGEKTASVAEKTAISPAPAEISPDAPPAEQLALAVRLMAGGKYGEALQLAEKQLAGEKQKLPGETLRKYAFLLAECNGELLKKSDPRCGVTVHVVAAGESFNLLARRFHTTPEAIRMLNQLPPDRQVIYVGSELKMLPGPWKIEVKKKARLVLLYRGTPGKLWGGFEIENTGTISLPDGEYWLFDRQKKPEMTAADGSILANEDPRNQLGAFLLKLSPAAAPSRPFLGTGFCEARAESPEERTVPEKFIRLKSAALLWLYQLVPVKSPVSVLE